ncbi:hypothetical protein Tsp_08444 [Trichinella spiralis]|uniref:hypothetical protein n=1 Tax=Trichinella spiralis TaxID=6334 RepID=UPI0001EFB779|nr:hypothetical protein Tsp_08444 [Trichinella spiralis]
MCYSNSAPLPKIPKDQVSSLTKLNKQILLTLAEQHLHSILSHPNASTKRMFSPVIIFPHIYTAIDNRLLNKLVHSKCKYGKFPNCAFLACFCPSRCILTSLLMTSNNKLEINFPLPLPYFTTTNNNYFQQKAIIRPLHVATTATLVQKSKAKNYYHLQLSITE